MFYQINLLAILAYLDQTGFGKTITSNLVDRKFKVVDCTNLDMQGYMYKQVMIKLMFSSKHQFVYNGCGFVNIGNATSFIKLDCGTS